MKGSVSAIINYYQYHDFMLTLLLTNCNKHSLYTMWFSGAHTETTNTVPTEAAMAPYHTMNMRKSKKKKKINPSADVLEIFSQQLPYILENVVCECTNCNGLFSISRFLYGPSQIEHVIILICDAYFWKGCWIIKGI